MIPNGAKVVRGWHTGTVLRPMWITGHGESTAYYEVHSDSGESEFWLASETSEWHPPRERPFPLAGDKVVIKDADRVVFTVHDDPDGPTAWVCAEIPIERLARHG